MSMDFSPPSYRAASSDLTISISPLGLVELADEDHKTCSKCLRELTVVNFQRRTRSRDGLMSQCRDCVNQRIRDNYRRDPATKIAKTRQYHLDHPEWSRQTLAEWHRENRDRRAQRVKDRLVEDPEFLKYRRDLTARRERQRRAEKIASEFETISASQYDMIFMQHQKKCWICEVELDRPVWDHYQPLSKGGPHVVGNLRPACGPCNLRKSATWPFTEADRSRIASEVRSLRASRGGSLVSDGAEV